MSEGCAKAASAPLPGWPQVGAHSGLAAAHGRAEVSEPSDDSEAAPWDHGLPVWVRTSRRDRSDLQHPWWRDLHSCEQPTSRVSHPTSDDILYIIRYSHWAPWFITMQRCLCWVTSVLGSIPSFGRCYWYYRASWLISPGFVDTHHWWKFNVLHDWNPKKWIGAWLGYFMGTIRRHISFCHIVTCPERELTYPHWYVVDWMLPCLVTK